MKIEEFAQKTGWNLVPDRSGILANDVAEHPGNPNITMYVSSVPHFPFMLCILDSDDPSVFAEIGINESGAMRLAKCFNEMSEFNEISS